MEEPTSNQTIRDPSSEDSLSASFSAAEITTETTHVYTLPDFSLGVTAVPGTEEGLDQLLARVEPLLVGSLSVDETTSDPIIESDSDNEDQDEDEETDESIPEQEVYNSGEDYLTEHHAYVPILYKSVGITAIQDFPGVVERLSQIAERVFPGRWDIRENELVIHFPEFQISNDAGLIHTIKDLYVRFCFEKDTWGHIHSSYYLTGRRTTFTNAELHSKYTHSHLPFDDRQSWTIFCTGSTTYLQLLRRVSNLYLDVAGEQDWLMFELLLHQTEQFLTWESINGMPYNYISKIALRKIETRGISDDDIWSAWNSFVRLCNIQHEHESADRYYPEISIDFLTTNATVIVDKTLQRMICQCTPRTGIMQEGVFVEYSGRIEDVSYFQRYYIDSPMVFKGNEIPLNIINLSDQEVPEDEMVAHPEIQSYIINRLNQHYTNAFFRIAFNAESQPARIAEAWATIHRLGLSRESLRFVQEDH